MAADEHVGMGDRARQAVLLGAGNQVIDEDSQPAPGCGIERIHEGDEVVGPVHDLDHDALHAQVVAPNPLHELGVVDSLDVDPARSRHLRSHRARIEGSGRREAIRRVVAGDQPPKGHGATGMGQLGVGGTEGVLAPGRVPEHHLSALYIADDDSAGGGRAVGQLHSQRHVDWSRLGPSTARCVDVEWAREDAVARISHDPQRRPLCRRFRWSRSRDPLSDLGELLVGAQDDEDVVGRGNGRLRWAVDELSVGPADRQNGGAGQITVRQRSRRQG